MSHFAMSHTFPSRASEVHLLSKASETSTQCIRLKVRDGRFVVYRPLSFDPIPTCGSDRDKSGPNTDPVGGEVPSRTIGAFDKTSLVLKTRTETAPQTSPLLSLSLSIA